MKEKYALLDTDFISKMHLIRKDDKNKLIDRIMKLQNYLFYCHDQVRIELMRHNIGSSAEWLERMIGKDAIHCFSDEEILNELSVIYADSSAAMYMNMLETGCEAYRTGFFKEKFTRLQSLDYASITKDKFLEALQADCAFMGEGQNLGELKTYVLLQMLSIKYGEQIYVFCSDDKNARRGIVSLGGARCISVLSSFMRLQKESDFSKEDAKPYFQSYLELCRQRNQTSFKIQDASKEQRMRKVPCEQVFEEMFIGKLEELQTGNLKYI